MKNLVVLGSPGSGKGTHGHKISELFNLKYISVGDVVKQEIRDKTKLGKLMFDYTSVGKFVPNDIVMDVLKNSLKDLKGFDGFIIDTAPINMEQKKIMDEWDIDAAIWLRIKNFDVARKRVLNRLVCPECKMVTSKTECPDGICKYCGSKLEQRYDDNLNVVNKRFNQYLEKTMPVINELKRQNKVIEINAEKSKETVLNEIVTKLEKFFSEKPKN